MALIPADLQVILSDTRQYLNSILSNENLSPLAEQHRIELLQQLSPYISSQEENGNVTQDNKDFEVIPTPRVCSQISNSSSGQSEDGICSNISFFELQTISSKSGPLWRREKIVFLEQWCKVMVGIYEHYLLIYCSANDLKPASSVNIQGFVARPAPTILKDPKKQIMTFELVCPGKKSYQFFARTSKDMHQWVVAICQASIKNIFVTTPILQRTSPEMKGELILPSDDHEENYDDISEIYDDVGINKSCEKQNECLQQPEEEEEEIYHDITDFQPEKNLELKSEVHVQSQDSKPRLLPRRPLPSIPNEEIINNKAPISTTQTTYINMTNEADLEVETEKEYNDVEEIYDDVDINERPSKYDLAIPNSDVPKPFESEPIALNNIPDKYSEIKPSFNNKKVHSIKGNGIKNIIKQMETNIGSGKIPVGGHLPKPQVPIKPTNSVIKQSEIPSSPDSITEIPKSSYPPLPMRVSKPPQSRIFSLLSKPPPQPPSPPFISKPSSPFIVSKPPLSPALRSSHPNIISDTLSNPPPLPKRNPSPKLPKRSYSRLK